MCPLYLIAKSGRLTSIVGIQFWIAKGTVTVSPSMNNIMHASLKKYLLIMSNHFLNLMFKLLEVQV